MNQTMITNTPPSEMEKYLPQCESIRGLAILLVFCFHYLGSLRGYMPYPELSSGLGLVFGGSTGVTLFFLLSGFLITRPFIQGAPLHISNFLTRRALRILPMYYFAIFISALISDGQWWAVLKSMFFYDINLGTLRPMGSVWWSLVVEVQFYLLLPLLVWLSLRPRWHFLFLPMIAGGLYSYFIIRSAPIQGEIWNVLRDSILGRWPIFLVGALLAWVQVCFAKKLQHQYRWTPWAGLPLILAALGVLTILCNHSVRNYGFLAHSFWYDHYLFEAFAWGLFVFALLNFRFPGQQIFVNPVLDRLGRWSYSLYLLHSGVIYFALKYNPIWIPAGSSQIILGGLLLLTISTALAAITYHFIEHPFLNIKPRLSPPEKAQTVMANQYQP